MCGKLVTDDVCETMISAAPNFNPECQSCNVDDDTGLGRITTLTDGNDCLLTDTRRCYDGDCLGKKKKVYQHFKLEAKAHTHTHSLNFHRNTQKNCTPQKKGEEGDDFFIGGILSEFF